MIHLSGNDAVLFSTKDTAIALGKFDGIHIGHQRLIESLMKEKEKGMQTLVFSFGDNMNSVLKGENRKTIYTLKEKACYFNEMGVDILLEYPFSKEFASLLPEEFVLQCLVNKLNVKSIYVGEDYCFGHARSGNVATLKQLGEKYNFKVCSIPKLKLGDNIVSSTIIREKLVSDFKVANQMLGNPYFVYGEVVEGKHLGRTIGFPTINQKIPDYKVVPQRGVYESHVWIDAISYKGISNLGVKPTIDGKHHLGLETYIFDYNGDLYGKEIKTELLSFLRPERKFDSVVDLTAQIKDDINFILSGKNT